MIKLELSKEARKAFTEMRVLAKVDRNVDVIRKGIAVYKLILDEVVTNQGKIYVHYPNGDIKEI